MKYRADIDGLRAVAVVSIVIFHLGLGFVPGGFAGVDIFFVISGFLISNIIYSELDSFSISNFYVRRARRILPALMAILVLGSICAASVLYPSELVAYAKSAIASALFSANIYFYSALSYFSPSADQIPLLHLWSLGVEEQFYILFPLIAIAIARRSMRALTIALVICALASLGASAWMLKVDPSASFYLIPFRAFELLIGCILALPSLRPAKSPGVSTALFLAGAASLGWSLFAYNSRTPFPGFAAMLPCLGAALIIYAGSAHQGFLTKLLGSRPAVYVGKISYSLYLVHWPIIVFGKRAFPQVDADKFAIFALLGSFLLASAMYYGVEQPFRRARQGYRARTIFLFSSAAIISVVALGGCVIDKRGFAGSVDARTAKALSYVGYDYKSAYRSRECFLDPNQVATGMEFSTCLPHGPGKKAMLWGDSHAAMLALGLGETFRAQGYSLGFLSASACPPAINYDKPDQPNCRAFNDVAIPIIIKMHPDLLVMTAEWTVDKAEMDQTDASIRLLTSKGIKVVILGLSPFYKKSVPLVIADRLKEGKDDVTAPEALDRHYLETTDPYMMKRFSGRSGVTYISVLNAMCPKLACPLVTADETPVHWDQAHLTPAGSRLFAKDLTPLILN